MFLVSTNCIGFGIFIRAECHEWEKMNQTLCDCGVRKSVELKNCSLLDITPMMEKTPTLSKSYDVKCSYCCKAFKGEQYLDSHMKFKHLSTTAENSHKGPQHRHILANLSEADVCA